MAALGTTTGEDNVLQARVLGRLSICSAVPHQEQSLRSLHLPGGLCNANAAPLVQGGWSGAVL